MSHFSGKGRASLVAIAVLAGVAWASPEVGSGIPADRSTARYLDQSEGRDWPGYGRTFGQQHYSPLSQINESTVSRLGLAWWMDLDPLRNSATQPIAVEGVLYFATGLSVVQAVDAASGKLLWRYDPLSAKKAGLNLRSGWGTRGIAWWNGKIYTGTHDGRLIALDAKRGQPVWSVQTFEPDYPAHINGAPRTFDGKVIMGYASTTGPSRGYVTAYDAETGRQLWRFYTVPGNPQRGFENKAMEMAAKTWAGEWWKFGGGADVWNAITYDAETDTVFIGTGSPYPTNRRARSADQGDNLFVSSIVALAGKSGAYKWHYQTTPGDTWDFDAVMDMELADLTIAGKVRKVLLQAPKNGFFYVIDRLTGELISAEPYAAKVTWASRIDLTTGRPVENPGTRYPDGSVAEIWPSIEGAHSWMPMAYSPRTRLAYIPKLELGGRYSDQGIDLKHWQPPTNHTPAFAFNFGFVGLEDPAATDAERESAMNTIEQALIAWDPVTQQERWRVPYPSYFNGGVLASGGDLVFQGSIDGAFKAYSAVTGKLLWNFPAQAPIVATPISYSVNGLQYVTVLTGMGMNTPLGASYWGIAGKYRLDPRSQARRVLTFKLDSSAHLPVTKYAPLAAVADPDYKEDAKSARAGEAIYGYCAACHGVSAVGVIHAPDLRRSGVLLSADAFTHIVRDGGLVPNGMPAFKELTDPQLADLRQYLRSRARELRQSSGERQRVLSE